MSFVQNMNATQQNVTKGEGRIIDVLKSDRVRESLRSLATQYMTPERATSLAVACINRTPLLQQCNQMSLLGAFAASFALGLEPNTPLGHAYLIPYKRKYLENGQWKETVDCQFQIGYKGFVALLERTGLPAYHFSAAIRENDVFEHDMMRPENSRFSKSLKDRGELIGAVFFMRRKDGGHAMHVMELEEIEKIRECSETYRSVRDKLRTAEGGGVKGKELERAQKNFNDTPWVKFIDEMAAKSVLKRAVKQLDLAGHSIRVASVLDDASDMKNVNLSRVMEAKSADEAIDAIEEAAGMKAISMGTDAEIEVPAEFDEQKEPSMFDVALLDLKAMRDDSAISEKEKYLVDYAESCGDAGMAEMARKVASEARAAKKSKTA